MSSEPESAASIVRTGTDGRRHLLETAVEGIAAGRHHPQPGMQCSWCQFRNECMRWPEVIRAVA